MPERRRRGRVWRQRQDRRARPSKNAPGPAADEDDGRQAVHHEMFFEAELKGADRLADDDEAEAQGVEPRAGALFAEAARDAHQRHGGADDGDGDVVVRPELALEPAHAEDTGEDHDAARVIW